MNNDNVIFIPDVSIVDITWELEPNSDVVLFSNHKDIRNIIWRFRSPFFNRHRIIKFDMGQEPICVLENNIKFYSAYHYLRFNEDKIKYYIIQEVDPKIIGHLKHFMRDRSYYYNQRYGEVTANSDSIYERGNRG